MLRLISAMIILVAACGGADDLSSTRSKPLDAFDAGFLTGLLETIQQLDGSHSPEWDVRDAEATLASASSTEERSKARAQLATAQAQLAAWQARIRPYLDATKRTAEADVARAEGAAEARRAADRAEMLRDPDAYNAKGHATP